MTGLDNAYRFRGRVANLEHAPRLAHQAPDHDELREKDAIKALQLPRAQAQRHLAAAVIVYEAGQFVDHVQNVRFVHSRPAQADTEYVVVALDHDVQEGTIHGRFSSRLRRCLTPWDCELTRQSSE